MTRSWRVLLLMGCMTLAPGCSVLKGIAGAPWGGSSGGRPGQDCYTQFGVSYCPMTSAEGFVETGLASWYGEDFHGKPTAMGEPYNMYAMTAAHKTLPLPTRVRVTNLETGRSAELRVNDRGPFVKGRVIDLSYSAARELGVVRRGTARVRIEALEAGGSPQPEQVRRGLHLSAAWRLCVSRQRGEALLPDSAIRGIRRLYPPQGQWHLCGLGRSAGE